MSLHEGLKELGKYNQFILWKPEWDEKKQKFEKKPCNSQGHNIDPHMPANWLTDEEAFRLSSASGHGVGFVLTKSDPFFCLDVDHCITGGNWTALAIRMFEMLPGAALELSFSGDGVHLWGTYWQDLGPRAIKKPGLELYTDKRFIALTNNVQQGAIWTDYTPHLVQVIDQYFQPNQATIAGEWTDCPRDDWEGPDNDDELIKIAMGAKGSAASIFGDRASFRDLWNGDPEVLSKFYPPEDGQDFGRNEADMALCGHLAFYTGGDCERIDRLFRRSALNREKWEDREDYRVRTLLPIIGSLKEVFGAKRKKERVEVEKQLEANTDDFNKPRSRIGNSFLTIQEQIPFFEGCVYIRGLHRIFIQGGFILDKTDFDIAYGGRTFVLDAGGQKTSRSAFEAFTLNQGYEAPWANVLGFRPELLPGQVYQEDGQRMLNSYVPVEITCEQGDITPFLDFLQRFLPDQNDRNILLSYMAAIVQYPGKKFPWCVLLQGVEGNGKSAIASILQYAVSEKYTHFADPRQLDNQFNDWMLNKVFIAIEEVKAKGQWGIMESLKTMITSKRGPITSKGKDQITADYRANFLMCSNYKDAVHKTRTDRRYCVFYTAQQEEGDLARDGMDNLFFKNLYDWFEGNDAHSDLKNKGFRYLAYYLKGLPIDPYLDPTKLCNRAPRTSSYEEVIEANVSPAHDEIKQAIEQYEAGFRNGWVSSVAMENRLKQAGIKYPKRKYPELMQDIGYVRSPVLNQGKESRSLKIPPDTGKRPTLYCSPDNLNSEVYRQTEYQEGGAGITSLY